MTHGNRFILFQLSSYASILSSTMLWLEISNMNIRHFKYDVPESTFGWGQNKHPANSKTFDNPIYHDNAKVRSLGQLDLYVNQYKILIEINNIANAYVKMQNLWRSFSRNICSRRKHG